MITKDTIKQKVAGDFPFLQEIRHHLHRHPELSFQETETASYIDKFLSDWNIEHETGVGGEGIVALIKGVRPDKKTIALRADMDALPIEEQNDTSYKSENRGAMHACGHDVHMTCLLGTAKLLQELKSDFEGTVKLIFQPAEETLPGGAVQMIKAGALENPAPETIIAQHVFPDLEVGKVGFKSGMYMASSDEINIYVKGKGGHAAIPGAGDDTVFAAAQIVVELKNYVKRNSSSAVPTVLSFGKIVGNGAHNVFPVEVAIHGTLRTFDETWRKEVHKIIMETAQKIAGSYGMLSEVVIDKGYPFLVNDDKVTRQAKAAAIDFLGAENVEDLPIRMTVEDFAYYAQKVPACFYRLGTANRHKGITSNLHTPTFDVDEESIKIGTGLMTWIALEQLNNG